MRAASTKNSVGEEMNTVNLMDKDAILEWMENWILSVNARTNFYKFIDATTKNEDALIDECQKI